MDLREALDSIAVIRRRMAETEVFRGYRALPVAFSAILALGAGSVQQTILPRPERELSSAERSSANSRALPTIREEAATSLMVESSRYNFSH